MKTRFGYALAMGLLMAMSANAYGGDAPMICRGMQFQDFREAFNKGAPLLKVHLLQDVSVQPYTEAVTRNGVTLRLKDAASQPRIIRKRELKVKSLVYTPDDSARHFFLYLTLEDGTISTLDLNVYNHERIWTLEDFMKLVQDKGMASPTKMLSFDIPTDPRCDDVIDAAREIPNLDEAMAITPLHSPAVKDDRLQKQIPSQLEPTSGDDNKPAEAEIAI